MDAPINPIKVGGKLLLIVTIIITPPLWWLHHTLSKGKIRTLAEQSVLQKVSRFEIQTADESQVFLVQEQGFHIAGFPVDNGKSAVWVLLDPKTDPPFKQMPKDKLFTINENQLNKTSLFCAPHPEVLMELTRRIAVEKNPSQN